MPIEENMPKQPPTKKLVMLISRLVVIALCCVAAYNLGKSKTNLDESKKEKQAEIENTQKNNDTWPQKYIYALKTSYCPEDSSGNKECYYSLFDINADKIPELFIQTGSNINKYELDIYTLRNGEVAKLAHTPFDSSELKYKENDLYIDWRDGNEQIVYQLKIENEIIKPSQIYEAKNIDVEGEFTAQLVRSSLISDYNLIENYK